MPARIAVIPKPPVLLDRDGTIGKAIEAIFVLLDDVRHVGRAPPQHGLLKLEGLRKAGVPEG